MTWKPTLTCDRDEFYACIEPEGDNYAWRVDLRQDAKITLPCYLRGTIKTRGMGGLRIFGEDRCQIDAKYSAEEAISGVGCPEPCWVTYYSRSHTEFSAQVTPCGDQWHWEVILYGDRVEVPLPFGCRVTRQASGLRIQGLAETATQGMELADIMVYEVNPEWLLDDQQNRDLDKAASIILASDL